MKLIISIMLLFLVTSANLNLTTDYQRGWSKGYKAGWCHERVNCIPPLPPQAPLPTLNCPKGYTCGYNRGFAKGLRDRK